MAMFGSDENINDIEALVPTEIETAVFVLTTKNVNQSISYTERRLKEYENAFVWRNS